MYPLAESTRFGRLRGVLASSLKQLRVFLTASSFAGSSPRDGPITKKLPLLGALSLCLMVRAKGLEPSWGYPHTDLNVRVCQFRHARVQSAQNNERHRERKNYFWGFCRHFPRRLERFASASSPIIRVNKWWLFSKENLLSSIEWVEKNYTV